MKRKSFLAAALLGAILMLFFIVWIVQREQARELVPPEEQILSIHGESLPEQPDVMLAIDPSSQTVLSHLYEGLYRFGVDGSIEPALVETLERSDDGKVYTFTLRESVTSKGNAITAQTFVDHFRKLADDETNSPFSFFLADVKNGKEISLGQAEPDTLGVKAIDDNTLELTLVRPMEGFEQMLAMPAFLPQLSPGPWEELETNGPFQVEALDENQLTLHKHDGYREAEKVTLEKILIHTERESEKQEGVQPLPYGFDVSTLDEEISKVVDVPRSGVFYLKPNVKKAPFDDPEFRRALALVINRNEIQTSLSRAEQTTERLLVMDEGESTTAIEGEAESLFANVKKRLGNETVEIELLSFVDEEARQLSTRLKNNLEELEGLKVNVTELPLGEKVRKEVSGNYEFSISGWQPDYPLLSAYLTQFETNNYLNSSRYSDETFDELMEKSRVTEKLSERNDILRQAEARLLEQGVVIPIYQAGVSYRVDQRYEDIGYPIIGPSYVLTFSKIYKK